MNSCEKVMEYMGGGSLVALLGLKTLDEKLKIKFASDCAAGIAYLHASNIVHRDIAARNVLLDSSQTVAKVADCK